MSAEDTHHGNYLKIWLILCALLVVSVLGPMLEIKAVTLITAFGIACIKAFLVLKHFMHIGHAPRFVGYLATTCLVFMVLFFAATAPDVMKDEGLNWYKPAWQADAAAFAAGTSAAGHRAEETHGH